MNPSPEISCPAWLNHLGPIALGCVTFGREIEQAMSFALMDHAWARGIRFFDTAAAYAEGASERIVGAWLAARRPEDGRPVVATKMLPPYDPDRIRAAVGVSLERLGRSQIDLFYLHRWDATAEAAGALTMLDELVRKGKVGALGVSNYNAEQLGRALQMQDQLGLARFQVLQNNHNFAVRDVTEELRALCAARGVAIVTYSPLGAGFLTGKHRAGVEPGSRFDVMPGHQRIYFNDLSHQRLARLEALAARTGRTMTELALAWALHQPGVASVLVGGRATAHVDQALAALALNEPALFDESQA